MTSDHRDPASGNFDRCFDRLPAFFSNNWSFSVSMLIATATAFWSINQSIYRANASKSVGSWLTSEE
jgi:hypothetical protein